MKRLIAVGDIHGQYEMLIELMAEIAPADGDQLVFLGDYIDRGPESPSVVDWLVGFSQQHPQTVFLRGNHEQMLLDAVDSVRRKEQGENNLFSDFLSLRTGGLPGPVFYFVSCGGLATVNAYRSGALSPDICTTLLEIPQAHFDFINRTRFYYLQDKYFFVHAGVDPKDINGEKSNNRAFLWERRPLWKKKKDWDKVVVHGHTPVETPLLSELEINLDTGAGYGERLTACDVLSGQVWSSGP